MRIIDDHNRLLPAMQAHQFEIEDFYQHLKVLRVTEFLQSPLETRSEVLLIDVPSLAETPVSDQLLAMVNTHPAVILFLPTPVDKKWQQWLDQFLVLTDKVIKVHQLASTATEWGLLKNQLLYFWRQSVEREQFKEQMVRFSQEMDEVIRAAQTEMLKAKKIHEGVVPKRSEDLKGVKVTSKYAVGEGGGSEYFDVIRGQTHAHLVFIHTSSYLASSCLMGILNKYKGGPQGLDPQLFLQEASLELKSINAHKKKPVQVQLLLLQIDHAALQCEGFVFGDFELIGQESGVLGLPQLTHFDLNKMEEARFKLKLSRGEKFIVFSPGFIFNWNETQGGLKLSQFVDSNWSMAGSEMMIELFFQIKKQSSSDMLAKDATTVMMEVNRHGIQQV